MNTPMKQAHERLMRTLRVTTHHAITLTERERRHGPIPRSNAAVSPSQQGKAKRVEIAGVVYESQTVAARALRHSAMTVSRMVREGRAKVIA